MKPLGTLRVTRRRAERVASFVLAVLGCAILLPAQSLPQAVSLASLPEAVSLATLVAYPDFYADRTLVAHGHLRVTDGPLSFEDEAGHRVLAVWRGQGPSEGPVEATGQLWDLGRMKQDDARLSAFDLSAILKARGQEWPRPGDVYVFAVTGSRAIDETPVSTIRSVVLDGARAIGRLVTLTGQFRGRNLFGDLPQAPGNGRTDFVLRASDAAIWVGGMAPRGKGFDLDPGQRVNTDRWLRVSGTVRETRRLMWIEAKSVELAQRDTTQTDAPARAEAPPPRPPEVLFSVPVDGETDVSPSAAVRIQLSRDLDPDSLMGHVRVSYLGTGAANAAPPPPAPRIRVELDQRERIMTLRFVQPLEPSQRVQIELLDGIRGTDGAAMKPWSLRFTVAEQ